MNDHIRILKIVYPDARNAMMNHSVKNIFLIFGIYKPLGLRRGLFSLKSFGRNGIEVYGLGSTLLYILIVAL